MKRLVELFFEFFKISLFIIGGGYAILAVADDVFAKKGWTEEGEIVDKLPVFQMVPGLIATHTAVYVGNKIAGRIGALVAVAAVALPSVVIFLFVAMGYESIPVDNPYLKSAFVGLRAALTGVILATIIRSWRRTLKDAFSYSLMLAALIALFLFDANIALVLITAMALGTVKTRTRVFGCSLIPFLIFFKYGLLCFGGGFVLVPMYIESFVGAAAPYLNVPADEFANLISLTQMTPGPIGVNGATFFGYRLGGIFGAVIASAGLLLPGSVLAYLALSSLERFKASKVVAGIMCGIRPASTALMISALWAFASADGRNPFFIALTAATAFMTMKRKLNVIVLILISAFLATAVRADEVTAERFPDADTVLVDDRIDIVYHADGTAVETDEEWVKILTEKGRRTESVIGLDYNLRYGRKTIELVEIIGADGSARKVDFESTLNESTDNESMASNIYDPMDRKLTCSVPGLAIGDVRHVITRHEITQSRVKDQWSDIEVLEYDFPILKTTVAVTGPAERPLKSVAVRHPLGNVTESVEELDGGLIRHVWTVENSPQAFPEPDMPPLYTEVQNLRLSTAENWEEISRWYWEVSLPHLEATNEAMTNMVAELGYDMRAIYDFVAQEVRYMGLTLEDTSPGYAPHDVSLTFDNRYGVCRDKAALLVAMLRLADFEAFPVLISASEAKMDEEVPMPYFNHAIVAVERDGEYILMDPTDESSADLLPGYLGDCSYLVARPEGDRLRVSPVPPCEANSVAIAGRGGLDEDGTIIADYAIMFNGVCDNMFRHGFLKRKPEERRKLVERIMHDAHPGIEIVDFAISPAELMDTSVPLSVSAKVKLAGCILGGDSVDELDIPSFSDAFGIVNRLLEDCTSLEKRRYPLRLMCTAMTREHLELDIGGVFAEPVSLPEGVSVSDGKLVFERERRLDRLDYPPAEYLDLRESVKAAEIAGRIRPVFERNRFASADIHVIGNSIEVDFTGERSWTVTNRVVKQVLTYDGKKKSAEVKFGFNPLWENVEIVCACVSNLDGTVAFAGGREINVMDADWVAFAPRYPASKQMVVSLPSVEIGSVISLTTVTTVTNAPAEFYRTFYFDSFEPADCISVRIGDEIRVEENPKTLKTEAMMPEMKLWRDAMIVGPDKMPRFDLAVKPVEFEIKDMKGIRDWMAKYIRIAGPGLYELPLAAQLTDPETVMRERYASRLDYIRTLCSLLLGAGYDASIVFASDDPLECVEAREMNRVTHPCVQAFSQPLCRVGDVFIGTEDEYTPLGSCALSGADYYDPVTGESGTVASSDDSLADAVSSEYVFTILDDGTVDLAYTAKIGGAMCGRFRRRYAEMLPEDRSREYQKLLGDVSRSAYALGELVTDVESYPAVMSYTARIPSLAVVTGDKVTLDLPIETEHFFPLSGSVRGNPIAIGGSASRDEVVIRVVFPEGYVQPEHLPSSYCISSPKDASEIWEEYSVDADSSTGRLVVTIRNSTNRRRTAMFDRTFFPLFREWDAVGSAKANRVISAGKSCKEEMK